MPRRSRGDDGRGDLAECPEPKGCDARKVAGQIETPRPPDPIMRRPCADREEKRVTHGNGKWREEQLDPHNPNQRRHLDVISSNAGSLNWSDGSRPQTWCGNACPRWVRGRSGGQYRDPDSGSLLTTVMLSRLMSRRLTAHSSFCSSMSAPARLITARSFGKMPTTSERTLGLPVEPFERIGAGDLWSVFFGKCGIGEHIVEGLIHETRKLRGAVT
jgi:hypothetical protein